MGQPTSAILAYGYDLGEGLQNIREAGEYGELPTLPWYDPERDDHFVDAAERRLLAEISGFTETWHPGNKSYFTREREAKARLGVEIEAYCSDSCPMFLLSAHVTTVRRGDIEHVDPADLAGRPVTEGWNAKLAAAVAALGITPIQPEPRWLLCSYWG